MNLKILIVDDLSTLREIMREFLEDINLSDFTEAEDGRIAWEILQEKKI